MAPFHQFTSLERRYNPNRYNRIDPEVTVWFAFVEAVNIIGLAAWILIPWKRNVTTAAAAAAASDGE